jgi:hypothetical protein
MSPRTSDDICKDINACSVKLKAAEKKAQDWRDTRRQFIQELKDTHPDIWLKEVKGKCQIGRAMAYRILQLPRPKNVDTSTDASLQSRQTPSEEIGGETAENVVPIPARAPEPREFRVRLSRTPAETPEGVAADAMLLVGAFLKQHNIDLQSARAELIRLLTAAQEANVLRYEEAPDVDTEASAEAMKEKMAELDAPAPERPKRGRPPGSKNRPKDPRAQAAAEPSASATEEQPPMPPAASTETEIPKDLSIPSFIDRTHEADARS